MDIIAEVESFLAKHKISDWRFGELAVNDRHFVRQLRTGREPRRGTVARVRTFMATYRAAPVERAA